MPASQARRLCPQAVLIPPDFTATAGVARVMAIVRDARRARRAGGLDEAYLDLTARRSAGRDAPAGRRIRAGDRPDLLGRARPNKLLAKLASDAEKPRGLRRAAAARRRSSASPVSRRDCPRYRAQDRGAAGDDWDYDAGRPARRARSLLAERFGERQGPGSRAARLRGHGADRDRAPRDVGVARDDLRLRLADRARAGGGPARLAGSSARAWRVSGRLGRTSRSRSAWTT